VPPVADRTTRLSYLDQRRVTLYGLVRKDESLSSDRVFSPPHIFLLSRVVVSSYYFFLAIGGESLFHLFGGRSSNSTRPVMVKCSLQSPL